MELLAGGHGQPKMGVHPPGLFFNAKSIYLMFLFNFFKKKFTKFIYHNFDFDIPSDKSNLWKIFFHKLELFFSKYVDYLVFPSEERSNIYSNISNIEKI